MHRELSLCTHVQGKVTIGFGAQNVLREALVAKHQMLTQEKQLKVTIYYLVSGILLDVC